MPKQLTTQNATITTAAVEVKSLTITGKQVTLAVFRQLREEALIADDGSLNGVPWGYVNYHPDKCSGDGHWHIVWQRETELLRCRVEKAPVYRMPFAHPDVDRYVTAAVLEHLDGNPTGFPDGSPITSRSHDHFDVDLNEVSGRPADEVPHLLMKDTARWVHRMRDTPEGITWEGTADPAAVRALSLSKEFIRTNWTWRSETPARIQRLEAVRTDSHELLRTVIDTYEATYEQLRDRAYAAFAAERERREQHRLTRLALADLPQLFIAV